MARKFGGKYSPDASSHDLKVDIEYRGPSVDPAGAKSNVMFIPAIVVAATSLGGGAIHMAMGLGAAALWTLGAWLLRDGLRAEDVQELAQLFTILPPPPPPPAG